MRRLFFILIVVSGCSPKVQPPDPESLKPSWLKTTPFRDGYYTGIGHSVKDGTNNYIQSAKKSALDDLVSQIKVNVSSTSVLRQLEIDKKLTEQYEQIIQTTAVDEIEEFELVDAWEDSDNYWVYYSLSIARYRQIKEEQKRNATILATDYFEKARAAEKNGGRVQAVSFYFQAFRSVEKYLGDAIRVTIEDREVLLINEIYASIQNILNKISIRPEPSEITLNRRVNQTDQTVLAIASYKDLQSPVPSLPLIAGFEKGAGDIFPNYLTNAAGDAEILITKIGSKELDQTVRIALDIDAISGAGNSPIYTLIAKTLNIPRAQVVLRVQRPIVFLTSEERSLGYNKSDYQLSNKLRNFLANNGFEFTSDKGRADLWFDVKSDSEKGSVSGSIYITYLTSVIKVFAIKEGTEIYATTLDRVKGYGLDYDKSSVDAYNKAVETLQNERMNELLSTVLQ
ncbi:MAG: LPP20 family lipoprotein [Cyclobacteriaceae bacterium]|nr:LPP20 family lipoprotein [Cyclobacteriaceae bacterium]MDH4298536.1 LPP20 family lipoprotein [Cyclobacteriaceae bacterium]MDH5247654.1 LPP20 family lipoprotein [Cyclobacteriaceae bacterium]